MSRCSLIKHLKEITGYIYSFRHVKLLIAFTLPGTYTFRTITFVFGGLAPTLREPYIHAKAIGLRLLATDFFRHCAGRG
jgi:hypothetical protein